MNADDTDTARYFTLSTCCVLQCVVLHIVWCGVLVFSCCVVEYGVVMCLHAVWCNTVCYCVYTLCVVC